MRISFLKMNGWKCLILKNAEFITEYCWIQKKSRKSNHVMSRKSIKIMRRRSK